MGLGLALPVTLAWAADPVAAPSAMAATSDTVVFAQADGRPVDDLASLTLDLLVSDAGFERHGVNLLLLFGDADAALEAEAGAP